MKTKIKSWKKETYISPDIEVSDIETEQNILASTSGLDDLDGEDWWS